MHRRNVLTTAGVAASFALCAGIVAGAPGCTPAPAAEAVNPDLAYAIERHRAALADMEASGRLQGACERAMRKLETPDTRSAFKAADDAFNLDCEREQAAHTRVIAAPIVTMADMRAKAAYLASVSRHIIHDGDTMAALLASMAAVPSPAEPAAEPDPLLALVAAYRTGIALEHAVPDDEWDARREEVAKVWRPLWDRLCSDPPEATSLAGVQAALQLVHDENATGVSVELTASVTRAALAYFGRA